MSLFAELKRRNVFRAGLAYIVAAWLVIQVVETIFPAFGFGDSAVRIVVIVVAIGLFPALILAWVFEFTPEGWRREDELDRGQSIAPRTGKSLDRVIIVALTLAVIYFAIDEFIIDSGNYSGTDKSIAVLPFINRSSITDDVNFVDGIHDDILTQLANLSGLDKVISRTSTEQYRQTDKSMPQIGEELDVATILEGGVQRAGDRVRINVQLINASTDEHIWAETYERELTAENLFAMQSEISREIVRELSAVLSDEDDERLNRNPTYNLDAYEAYVMGRQALVNRTAEGILAAKTHFEKAIALDPDYALAYVGLADAYGMMGEYVGTNREDAFAPRQSAIDRALELDSRSGDAYAALGNLRWAEGRMAEAETYLLRAIALSPKSARAYQVHTLVLRDTGRIEEAILQVRKALEFDPAAPVLTTNLVILLHMQGRMEEALAAAMDGVKRSPEYPGFYENISNLLQQQGRIAEALRWALGATTVAPMNPRPRINECQLYIVLGDDAAADSCLREIRHDFPQLPEGALAHTIGQLFSFRGQNQAAVDYLMRQIERDEQNIGLRYELAFHYMANSRFDEARAIYRDLEPAFFTDDDIVIGQSNYRFASLIGILFYNDGEFDQANHLFDGALAAMRSMHRTRGYGYGISDVLIHATRGDSESAISALRDAIDDGWREQWWYLRHAFFEPMRAEPAWNDLVAEIEADIASQRAWLEEYKDEPLY